MNTFIEMFCGIGGFRLGLEKTNQIGSNSQQGVRNQKRRCESRSEGGDGRLQQKFHCVWANDNDKYACQIYRKNFGDKELVEADIKTVDADTIPDHMLLTAGFPCQAFSVAGKRKGFEDTRGTLFYDIARVAEAKRPKLLLLENVKGLLSHDEGLTFQIIIESLEELGYLLEWQVLNSKHFGVPQNRERVFIVGHLRGAGTKQIFPIGEVSALPIGKAESEFESGEASTLEASYGKNKNLSNMVVECPEVAKALSGGGHSGGLHSQMTTIAHGVRSGGRGSLDRHTWDIVLQEHSFSGKNGKGRGLRFFEGNVPALTKQMGTGGNNVPMVVADRTRSYANKGRSLESPKQETNALSSVQKDNLLLKNYRIRRLTPTECERLQGFPDRWTEGVSDTQRYKLLGNAVTVNVVEFLGRLLIF